MITAQWLWTLLCSTGLLSQLVTCGRALVFSGAGWLLCRGNNKGLFAEDLFHFPLLVFPKHRHPFASLNAPAQP